MPAAELATQLKPARDELASELLQRLADAGVPVVAITGRPAGWSEPFALAWPVAAIVAERGVMWAKITTKGRAAHAGKREAVRRRPHHAPWEAHRAAL